ncbi:MAG TPA: peptidylprolyl isomerase [Polyangiaceae bacterium]|jgi:hypothetical protein|nr:peptidylprolyl isomerase [Polyangiaceae bacterium]
MTGVRVSVVATLLALVAAACHGSSPSGATHAPLPAGIAAIVGTDSITAATVTGIANAQGISFDQARARAVQDALFAAEATSRYGSFAARAAKRQADARAILDSFTVAASAAGAPTDAEVATATERRFWELDQPLLLRTTHACALVKKPEDDARARALAAKIALAVASATDAAAFHAAASAVPTGGLDVRVEDLMPVARDGRAVDPATPPPPGSRVARYAGDYVKAAFAVGAVGQESPVVRTDFGYHVILVTAIIPEHRVPLEERRKMLAPEIFVTRAERLRLDALTHSRQIEAVVIDRAADELTARAKVTP